MIEYNKEEIFVNEKHWRGMSETQLEGFTQLIFNYYRQVGFPYYPIDKESRNHDFKLLMNYDRSNLFEDKIFKQTMHGLGLAWSYFPHSFEVKCGNKITPYDAFMNINGAFTPCTSLYSTTIHWSKQHSSLRDVNEYEWGFRPSYITLKYDKIHHFTFRNVR